MKKGFTLIELLVVIAVLAVLAAGVMVAINPLKRINQANDAKIRNDVGQIATGLQAYFTTNQTYPLTTGALQTSQDLKNVPLTPAGVAYTYAVTPGTCAATAANPCTDSVLYATLNDPKTAGSGNIWCWQSRTAKGCEVASGGCSLIADATCL